MDMSKSQLKRPAVQTEDENKKLVLSKYPDAYAVKPKNANEWQIWSSSKSMSVRVLGRGDTPALAWADAAKRIREGS